MKRQSRVQQQQEKEWTILGVAPRGADKRESRHDHQRTSDCCWVLPYQTDFLLCRLQADSSAFVAAWDTQHRYHDDPSS